VQLPPDPFLSTEHDSIGGTAHTIIFDNANVVIAGDTSWTDTKQYHQDHERGAFLSRQCPITVLEIFLVIGATFVAVDVASAKRVLSFVILAMLLARGQFVSDLLDAGIARLVVRRKEISD
jgi:hypothetical protein